MTKSRPSSQKTAKIKRGVIMLKKKCYYKSQSEFLKGLKYSVLGSALIFAGLLFFNVICTFFLNDGAAPPVLSEDYSNEFYGIVTVSSRTNQFIILAAGGLICGFREYGFFLNKNQLLFLLGTGNKRRNMLAKRTSGAYFSMLSAIIVPFLINLAFNISAFGFNTEYLKLWAVFVFSAVETVLVFYTLPLFALYVSHGKASTLFSFAGAAALFPSISFFVHYIFNKNLTGYSFKYRNANLISNYFVFAPLNPFSNILSFYSDYSYGLSFDYSVAYKKFDLPFSFSGAVFAPVLWIFISLCVTAVIIYSYSKKYKAENVSNERHPVLITSLCALSASMLTFVLIEFIILDETAMSFFVRIIISLCVCFGISFVFFMVRRKAVKLFVPVVASSCVFALFYLISVTGGFGYETKIPDIEKIKSAQVYIGEQIVPFESLVEFTDEKDIEAVTELHSEILKNDGEKTAKEISLKYTLKSGISYTRSYENVSVNSFEKLYGLFDTEAVKDLYKRVLFCDKEQNVYKSACDYENEIRDYCTDFNNSGSRIYVLSEDFSMNDVTKKLSEKDFEELKKSIFSDICSLSAEELFLKNEKTAGYILFSERELSESVFVLSNSYPAEIGIPVKMNMKNTLNALEKFGLTKYLQKESEIKSINIFSVNKEFKSGHYFFTSTQDIDYYDNLPYVRAEKVFIKKITNQKEAEDTFKKCNTFCKIEETDWFASVEFKDGHSVVYVYKV